VSSGAYRFERDHTLGELLVKHKDLGPGQQANERVRVAGRLISIRRHGGLSFAHIVDRSGSIQLFVDTRLVGTEPHRTFDDLGPGDWVGAEGRVMTTRRGELSIEVGTFEILGRAARPLPGKWKGLRDVEIRYRQRYLDLIVNEETRRIFNLRFKVVAAIREYLTGRGFVEVETPVLGIAQGGATARPFITHHNALDLDMYLRIALELHLKRLIVGDMDRVFEIGRVFRNEGLDTHHNPEFTMLEAYQAFADYRDMMDLAEGIVVHAAKTVLGDQLVIHLGEESVDIRPPWPRMTMSDLIAEKTGLRMTASMPVEEARGILDEIAIPYHYDWGSGRLMKELYDKKVQSEVRGPLLVLDYPLEVSPLARVHRDDPSLAERFELIVGGHEICNAFSEQNDPITQRQAFEAEARAKEAGDVEAGDVDTDYVRALEYGMPCAGGLGIGIDRLVMLLAGVRSIREVILFPTLQPEFALPPRLVAEPRLRRPPETPAGAEAAPETEPLPEKSTGERPQAAATAAHLTRAPQKQKIVRLFAGLTALGGLGHILTLVPLFELHIAPFAAAFGPLWFRITGHVATLMVGFLLLTLADQLWKGKRTAWRIATALFALATVLNIVRDGHVVKGAYAALMTIGLVVCRQRFRAPADPPSLLRLLRLAPLYVLVVALFGFSSLLVERHHVRPELSFGGMLTTIAGGLVGVEGVYTYEQPFFAQFFPAALLVLGVSGLVGLLVLLFRPLVALAPHTRDDWDQARRLVHSYGWDTLAYFVLRDDKSFFFSSDGEAMLGFTYLGGYALVSGDPIGAPSSVPLLLDEFLAFCGERAWNPAFLAVRQIDVPLYAARGFRHLYLGDEAIIHCDTFTLKGSEMKGVREAVRRVAKRYRFELMEESKAPASLVKRLNGISRRWRGKKPERGFTMALSQEVKGRGKNPDFLLCVAFDEKNIPGGFLRLVPAYGPDFGYTLDLMRHDPSAPNGMTEFLVARTALALKQRGIVRLSMNFAAFGRLMSDDVQRSPVQRVVSFFASLLNPFFQVKSLHSFNAKFRPEWYPRVLVFRTPIDLPRVGVLYIGAEGLLAIPGIGPLLVPRAVGGVPAASTDT
jgi:lysyl-tRNA synthetase, class II